MKAMLASDYDESKLRFPLIAQPKIDGVRALNVHGTLYGRSLKQHRNRYATSFFSRSYFAGLDGEMAADHECHPDLCRKTSSALSSIEGKPFLLWWVFDYVTAETKEFTYHTRLMMLQARVDQMQRSLELHPHAGHLRIIPWVMCTTIDELLYWDNKWVEEGYEGTIIRDPNGKYKEGRSTVKEGGLLRIKRFLDSEAIVEQILEGEMNQNEAQINELGLQFRSTEKAGMVANGMVGRLVCRALDNVKDGSRVVIRKDQIITVGPGRMSHGDRRRFFQDQRHLKGKVIKYKFFPKGIKDKPRFPTFECIRSEVDM